MLGNDFSFKELFNLLCSVFCGCLGFIFIERTVSYKTKDENSLEAESRIRVCGASHDETHMKQK